MKNNDYENEYHGSYHERLLKNKDYYFFRALYSEANYWKHFNNAKNGKFAEFGCGIGQNIALHKNNCTGIDISRFAREQCQNREISVSASIDKIKHSSLNGILCCHVLEHLENPAEMLKKFLKALDKGGRLVLVLPNCNKNIIREPDLKSGHIYNWTFSTIGALLHLAGFKVKAMKFNYASGFSVFYKLPPKLAFIALKLLGHLRNEKEMVIVAEKP